MPPFQPGWILLQISKPASRNAFRHSPRIPAHPACRTLSTLRNRRRIAKPASKADQKPDPGADPDVRIFEQHGAKGRLERVNHLDFVDDGPILPGLQNEEDERWLEQNSGDIDSPLDMSGIPTSVTEEEREEILRELRLSSGDVEQVPEQDLHFDNYHVEATDKLPRQSLLFLRRLNKALDELYAFPEKEKVRKEVWLWYTRCKHGVPNFVKIVPRDTWNMLRESQLANKDGTDESSAHLSVLATDKKEAGWDLTEPEQLVIVEGTFLQGQRKEALETWERMCRDAAYLTPSLLKSGMQMLALDGQIDRAEEIATDLFARFPREDPRILVSVISACCVGPSRDVPRALKFYDIVRQKLGDDMTMEDFDEICNAFMAIGAKDAGLVVFRDMMLTGEVRAGHAASIPSSVNPSKSIGELLSMSTNAEEATHFALETLKWLPRRFQNKWFYASWLKKLIGENDIASATQVIDLMYERGIKPDARHMNGLITTWMRDGSAASRQAAEVRGWSMIQKRLDYVTSRKQIPQLSAQHPTLDLPIEADRKTPMATIETFCVLVQFYLRRSSFEHVRHLRDLLDAAEIPMNSFFLNHLLQAEMRTRGPRATMSRFNYMTRTVAPDMESYIICWEALKRHLDTARISPKDMDLEYMPSAREFFARMIRWYSTISEKEKIAALDDLEGPALNEIIRAFCLSLDLEGAFVALTTIYRTFDVRADANTAHHLLLMVSRLDVANLPTSSRRLGARGRTKQNMNQAAAVLEQVRRHRRDLIVQSGGVDPWPMAALGDVSDKDGGHNLVDGTGQMTKSEVAIENTRTLATFLYAVIANRRNDEEQARQAVEEAMKEMGVKDQEWDSVMELTIKTVAPNEDEDEYE